jgi:hypothetical protein
VEFLSHEWLLTLGTPLVDPRKRQTSTATPAKPGGLPLTLVWLETSVVDRLRALRGPGESYSDVILKLVELEAKGEL